MNHLTKSLSILTLSLAVGSAEAAVASASASIDWSTFTVTGYAMGPTPGPTISWNNQSTSVSATSYQPNNNQYNSSSDWTSSIAASASSGTLSSASALADAGQLVASAQDTDVDINNSSSSWSYRYGDFTVSGNGILVFSVDYSLATSLVPGDLTYTNYANTGVFLSVQNYSQVSNGYFTAQQNIYLDDGNVGQSPLKKSDTLYLALVVKDGDAYHFQGEAYASSNAASVVPVPSAVWMFLSAIGGFIGVTRRRPTIAA